MTKRFGLLLALLLLVTACGAKSSKEWVVPPAEYSRLASELTRLGVGATNVTITCDRPSGSERDSRATASLVATLPTGEVPALMEVLRAGDEVGELNGWRSFNLPSYDSASGALSENSYLTVRLKGTQIDLFAGGLCTPA